jgi:hypothetical protein
MSQYLLSTYAVEGEVSEAPTSPEEMQAFMGRVAALEAEVDASGTFVFGGALHDPGAATVVRSSGGDPVVTDGPFVETKEALGGYYIVECRNLDEAIEAAQRVPSLQSGGSVEIRPLIDM